MEHLVPAVQSSPLFSGLAPPEILSLLACQEARHRSYAREEYIWRAQDRVPAVGLVVSGSVHVIQEDYWGRRTIMARVAPGEVFGESYAGAQRQILGVSVVAAEHSGILFMDLSRGLRSCSRDCPGHTRFIANLVGILSEKNLGLTEKIGHMSRRSTREKLMSYLSRQAQQKGSNTFSIPFNRQQLADYLCVDRSAMSSELGRMRQEGIVDFERNRFVLRDWPENGEGGGDRSTSIWQTEGFPV